MADRAVGAIGGVLTFVNSSQFHTGDRIPANPA